MTKPIRDLCPMHRVPMWYTPMDGTYACQVITCQITAPVNEHGSFKPAEDFIAAMHAPNYYGTYHARMMAKARLLNTPPTGFLFRGTIT